MLCFVCCGVWGDVILSGCVLSFAVLVGAVLSESTQHRLCLAALVLASISRRGVPNALCRLLNNPTCLKCRGRVLVWHPHTRTTHMVASGFYYSDGIAVADDGSYLLVVETDALRVNKLWLTGDKVGSHMPTIHCLCCG